MFGDPRYNPNAAGFFESGKSLNVVGANEILAKNSL